MRGMNLRQKIAQMVVIHSYGEDPSSRSKQYKEFVRAVRDLRVGGIIVVNRVVSGSVRNAEPHAMATFLNRMQKIARVPLIMAGDFERGASMRVSNTTKFPHLMAYGAAGDPELTKALGAATAKEARALGIHWVFAPDADVNSNPDNPIINTRSFGESPVEVASQVRAFIQGAHADPRLRVLVTAKHFPGHGDTSVDSHIGLASIEADKARMDATELVPFRAAIAAGVDSVMTAHMTVKAYEPEEIPATVSKNVLTGLLREELNFQGIIVTDAMDMQGLAKQYPPGEAAVRAVMAGADVLLMPPDPEAAIKAVYAAVRDGRITEKRINESVMRVLAAKARVGLHRRKLVDIEAISDAIESDEWAEQAQTAADRAVTLVKKTADAVPLKTPESACVYVLTESRYGQTGRRFADEVRARNKAARVVLLEPQMPQMEIDSLAEKSAGCSANVVAASVSVGAYRGNVALAGNYPALVAALMKGAPPVVLISFGSPYLLRGFPEVSAYLATYSTAPTSEVAAAKALFGEIPITGKLPVTIPGVAARGEGIQLPLKQ
jgi:beta-N-acetylhexosaminidase